MLKNIHISLHIHISYLPLHLVLYFLSCQKRSRLAAPKLTYAPKSPPKPRPSLTPMKASQSQFMAIFRHQFSMFITQTVLQGYPSLGSLDHTTRLLVLQLPGGQPFSPWKILFLFGGQFTPSPKLVQPRKVSAPLKWICMLVKMDLQQGWQVYGRGWQDARKDPLIVIFARLPAFWRRRRVKVESERARCSFTPFEGLLLLQMFCCSCCKCCKCRNCSQRRKERLATRAAAAAEDLNWQSTYLELACNCAKKRKIHQAPRFRHFVTSKKLARFKEICRGHKK